ncbi:MAG: transcriptional regulator [Cyanothece sp. SIO1E1]|nr:transcriptional regulator [Cyanothece sp. SIO1E1]
MAKVALLIGVSDYGSGFNPLPGALRDVEAVQRVLQNPELGAFDEVKTIKNPDPQKMQEAIEVLFSERVKNDLVLLFFSGHGVKDDSGRLYFATPRTRKSSRGNLIKSTAVPADFVQEVMSTSRARRQAIILDCCFSGAFDSTLGRKDDGSVDLQGQLGAEGRVVLASSSSTQYSFEQQGAELSIYTQYLVEGIETGAGDLNEDGHISILELHDYASSKVRETAPNMTPKMIVLKDMGFEIILAKARIAEPKLRYRKETQRYASRGEISPVGRVILNKLREELGLSDVKATEIENEVLRPYQKRLENLQEYKKVLSAAAEHEYPFSEDTQSELRTLQEILGLRNEDISSIKQEIVSKFTRRSEAYQRNLQEYEQKLSQAIQREFPLGIDAINQLNQLQQTLKLSDTAVVPIKSRILEGRRIYEGNLERYKQEFSKAVQAEYPLNEFVCEGLKNFQQSLKLRDEDIERVERPIRAQKAQEITFRKQKQQQGKPEVSSRPTMQTTATKINTAKSPSFPNRWLISK